MLFPEIVDRYVRLVQKERLEQEAKMRKFEIGDTVQVVKANYEERPMAALSICNRDLISRIGVIETEMDRDGDCFVSFPESFITTEKYYVPVNWLKLVKKAEKYWTGKVVCIKADSCSAFKLGKAYTIENGAIKVGRNEALNSKIKSIDDLNSRHVSQFMEFKGFADEGKDKNE